MATLVKSTFMGLRKPKLECCTNRFQYLAFASPVRVLNSMLWWHFGFKFCALAPWSVNFQSGGPVRHRGHIATATSAAICLLPAAKQSGSWCRLVVAFTSGVVLTIVAGFWWLLHLDD